MPSTSPSLQDFAQRLMQEKGFDNLSLDEETKKTILEDIITGAQRRIDKSIIAALPPEQTDEFERLLDADTGSEELQRFCQTHIENIEAVVAKALLDFRTAYLQP